MSSLKILGIVLVIIASTLIGFLKSRSLVARSRKLSLLCDGTNMLYEYIEQEGCELMVAIKKSFSKCHFLHFEDGKIFCRDDDLKWEEKNETEEFFMLLGSSAKKAECDRIVSFKLKINRLQAEAENDVLQKSKIYQTFGICVGLAIGILLI